ncbi:MAG: 4Fe-4S dicluster domain-containing protein [Candidatus Thorarchaeota archaeon]|jgi:ferredoxin
MSGEAVVKEIAPKRKRMMDMMLALGGLKEETAIPLSKVSEEITQLKQDIQPITKDILDFPDTYLQEFFETVKKTGLANLVTDRGVLSEAIENLESALGEGDSSGVSSLLEVLKDKLGSMAKHEDVPQVETKEDIASILSSLPDLITKTQEVIDGFEQQAKADEETARKELDSLTESFSSLIGDLGTDPDASLDALQKLGTKTRYGPFLRIAAQLKRGKREDRIDDDRFKILLSNNLLLELRRGFIMFVLNKMGSKTAVQLGEIIGIDSEEVQTAIISMMSRSEVEMVGLDNDAPVFSRVLGKTPDTTLVVKRVMQQLRSIVKTLEEPSNSTIAGHTEQLQTVLERLQKLGEYDESVLSESVTELQELVEKATEAAIGSQTSDDSEELRLLVSAGLEAFARFRLKITLEKGPNLVSGLNVYGESLDPEVYKQIMDNYLDSELERGTILILIRELGALTAKDLAEKSKIPQDRILQHLLRMKRDELLTTVGEDHGYIVYDVPRTLNEAEIAIQTVSSLAAQITQARSELNEILEDLKPETIGRLTGALEVFSRSRDKLEKTEVEGSIVAPSLLSEIEDKIKSAVSMGYRTRARLPSTRPKVTIDDLMDVDVPSVLEEYQGMMGYAPLLGFGTIDWDHAKCLGCKSCEIVCPENAIELRSAIDIPQYFEFTQEQMDTLPVNRAEFYKTVKALAAVKPTSKIQLDGEKPGFGEVEVDLWLCVGCRTCVRRCPGPDQGALELELRWNLPEVVRHITTEN